MVKLLDNPCPRCGWRFPGYHICQDLSKPDPVLPPEKKRKTRRGSGGSTHHARGNGPARSSTEWREAISEGMQPHLAALREKNKDRDETIVELYRNGLTFRQISEKLTLNHQTVSGALHRAQDAGLVVIRPPAHLLNKKQ